MYLLPLTLPSPAENLALDEALLLTAEQSTTSHDVLRLWEPQEEFVVVGRGSRLRQEVDVMACRRREILVLRRCSGGCAVVAGPGCLMYAVVLSLANRPQLRNVGQAHQFVLGKVRAALTMIGPPIQQAGLSDLVVDSSNENGSPRIRQKVSGNSLRLGRSHLLYHGTLLYEFRLDLVSQLLTIPPRQPDYRGNRPHEQFLANYPVSAESFCQSMQHVWAADRRCPSWPAAETEKLSREKYQQPTWNLKF